jgi:UDP-N-acetylglucosamine 4-epimerase
MRPAIASWGKDRGALETMKFFDEALERQVRAERKRWLVTGAAGFIGSNIVEALLNAGQQVVGLDNFSTGHQRNLDELSEGDGSAARERFTFIKGDIRNREDCAEAVRGVDYVLHQAALGSVPRSIDDPLASHDANVTGFLNILDASRQAGVARFVYAASSSTYGDDTSMPKREETIGQALSPYAATKLIDEIYAGVYARTYGFNTVGLRYFNVFGPRQDPEGAYAAVIPAWAKAMLTDEEVVVNGDGETSRDFCFVANAVQANVRSALAPDSAQNEVYNVAVGERTTLNELFAIIRSSLERYQISYRRPPVHGEFRTGDIRHTLADISKAERMIGYRPTYGMEDGMSLALPWYIEHFRRGGF